MLGIIHCDGASTAACADMKLVHVLVSQRIKPYMEALSGISQALSEEDHFGLSHYFLDEIPEKGVAPLLREITAAGSSAWIGIGPQALEFIRTYQDRYSGITLYTMTLNPDRVAGSGTYVCGVPLQIPVRRQVAVIAQVLPQFSRWGVLFDPANSSDFYAEAKTAAMEEGLTLVPLPVQSKKDIPSVLKAHWRFLDGVWMIPDSTVISERIVQYVIKEGLIRNRGVVGYNRFFQESGALLTFQFDYERLGRQAAELARVRLNGGECTVEAPDFSAVINERILERIQQAGKEIATEERKMIE